MTATSESAGAQAGVQIVPATAQIVVPPGRMGPAEVTFSVASFVARRGNSIVVVDALMQPEHAELIEAALREAGAGFGDIGQIVLTHHHPDHTGGLAELVHRAPQAQVLAGRGDVDAIRNATGVAVDALVTGDDVAGLEVIETPGHTPGHLCLFDSGSSTMLLGDLAGNYGEPQRPPAQFTEDADRYEVTLRSLVERDFAVALPSHGEAIRSEAAAVLRRLAAQA